MNVIARSLLCLAMGGTLVCRAQQPGMLDTTFAGQGKLLLPGFGPVVDLELDSMGRILALTSSGSNSILIRLTASGQLDSTFGSFGSVICPNAPRRVLIQTDARILLLGNQVGTQGIVQRLEVDGGIDSTYGTAGQVVLPHGTFIRDGDLLADDKLMVTGDSTYVFNTDRAFLLKILSNGQADGSFAANGWLVIGGVASACYQQHWHGCEVRHADGDEFVWVRSTARHTCYPGGAYPRVFYSLHQADGGTLSGYDTGVNNVDASVYHHSLSVDPARGFHSVFGWNGDAQFRFSMFTGFTATLNYSPCPSSVATYGGIGRTCHDQFAHFIVPTNDNKFEVIRTLPDTIMGDCSWGIQGSVITDFVPSGYGGALVATPQVDGKLLVGGYAGWVGSHTFVIARYHNIPDPRAKLDLRLFLGGSWDPNTVLMHDSLRVQGLLPVQQPYLDSTFVSVNGVGAGMTSASVLDESGAGAAVDWVWLELLDAADTSTVVATRAGLLRRDGRVTSPINHDPIDFSVGAGSYFLRVRHRNHLGVTVSVPLALSDSTVTIDLTDPATPTFGTQAQMESHGVHMLWPGDVTGDGLVRYAGAGNDRDAVLVAIGGTPPTATATGYAPADVNMDGVVKYAGADNDRDVILQSIGGVQPTAVRVAQGP